MRRVQLVQKNHARPFQRANRADIAIIDLNREAFLRNQIVDGVEEVGLVIVIFALCDVEIAVIDRLAEELEVDQQAGIKMSQSSEAGIESDAVVWLMVQNASRNDCAVEHHRMNNAG